jgi:hypothetical protein
VRRTTTPLDPALNPEDIYCLEYTPVIGNDYVVRFEKQELQLHRAARGRVPAGSRVLVWQTRDGRILVLRRRTDGTEIVSVGAGRAAGSAARRGPSAARREAGCRADPAGRRAPVAPSHPLRCGRSPSGRPRGAETPS